MTTLFCKISRRGDGYEGTVTIPGLNRTKLVRASDSSSVYGSRSGVTQAARALATKMGFEVEFDDTTKTATKSKKVATVAPDMGSEW